MPNELQPKIFPLVGTCSAGKTTLFERLKAQFDDQYAFVPESARIHYEQNAVPVEQRSSYANQTQILKLTIEHLQKGIAEGKPVVITDSACA